MNNENVLSLIETCSEDFHSQCQQRIQRQGRS